ncbi:AurF N-oxygenase family protein [Nocardioides jiangxiensis]|uniref:Diiron oxygenase n=1 Tax=Nocardioides jiangxiensis TaxID=3064524 RepID=A0ABT9AYU6_9ACTN|nr:diiron oxygenase [Nocardioides sp. WY-20]MDO7867518.1 diiron oxygenase [Nocardioides sp. WY-20]
MDATVTTLASRARTSSRPSAADATAEYHVLLRRLSEASVEKHFQAFRDIPWDAPEFEVDPHDPRFVLGEVDEIGAHPWYQSLPLERQVAIGRYRYAQVAKVGLQFEQLLIAGVMNHLVWARNGNPEFRYAMHEVTEETHHIQMFQEGVNRLGADAAGAPAYFKLLFPLLSSAGAWWPALFFTGILAGEEPIDHLQKSIMRHGGSHPMVDRIMQIHIAEEARHISFAHEWLKHEVPTMGVVQRTAFAVLFPLTMRVLCDVIMVPSRRARRDMGIPRSVAREIWWGSEASGRLLREMFGDVRMLADELGIRGPVTKRLWRVLGIDGRPSRFRAEPARLSA